jgi:hypothetical protein
VILSSKIIKAIDGRLCMRTAGSDGPDHRFFLIVPEAISL